MLADLDDPPRSRLSGFVIGALLGLPVVVGIAWLVLPPLMGAVLGGAEDFDERLRREDAYMQGVCGEIFDIKRDEALCGCVWAAEFPALDCQHRFRRWRLERAHETCAGESARAQALSYCSCVDVIAERVRATATEAAAAAGIDLATQKPADPANDPIAAAIRPELAKFDNCLALDDVLEPPPLESLRAPGSASATPAAADAE